MAFPVRLRAPRAEDWIEVVDAEPAPEVLRGYGVDPSRATPMTEARARAWVERVAADPLAWVIEADGRVAGQVRLHSLNMEDRRAGLAVGLLRDGDLGRGIGRRAIRLALAEAFGPLELHRVSVRVLAMNARAIRCYRACGFVEEGRERESARLSTGEWADDLLMGLLARDFTAGS
ncbi:MAG: GNAT family N-acetyltransferase [Rhodobacteraceae bacterium]|jgi:RimJ/RimL family protein N-acetyltransferase|nr:GNAT family N-acetyltransferase [Paracoccaceae bacterium]